MSINWVMTNHDGEVVKLPSEKVYYKVRSRIALDLSPATTPPSSTGISPLPLKSDAGVVYITNLRVIYLPASDTTFRSFSAPLLDFDDTRVASSFFGPWSWTGLVRPTPGGGVPSGVPRLACRLTFREGGHDAFQSKFEVLKERSAYARTLQQETGQVIPTGEDLPRYEERGGAAAAAATAVAPAPPPQQQQQQPASAADAKEREALGAYEAAHEQAQAAAQARTEPRNEADDGVDNAVADGRPAVPRTDGGRDGRNGGYSGDSSALRLTPTPDEPPPDYEEAQAQAVGIRLEARLREEAEQ